MEDLYIQRIKTFVAQMDALAEKWGTEIKATARLAMREGVLSINRNNGAWRFMWTPKDQPTAVPLGNAPVTVRMDAVDVLEDLYAEMQRTRRQRLIDLDDAITIVEGLLAK